MTSVNGIRLGHHVGPLSWNTAVKFMMARKFDLQRALLLYEAHEVVRHREGLASFDPTRDPLKSELDTGKFTVLPTRDKTGAAISVFTASKHFLENTSHQITLQGMVYQLDVALDSLETQRCGIVFIYNMTNSKYANFDYELSLKILNLLKGAYPARLKKVLILSAPIWFRAPFSILRLFVREKLRERIYMLGPAQLTLHVAPSALPQDLGGSLEVNQKAWLLHCLKSTTNRYSDLCDLASLSSSFPLVQNGVIFHPLENSHVQNGLFRNFLSEGENTDESSEQLHSAHEKHSSEDREKEVEVTKEKTTGNASRKATTVTHISTDREKHLNPAVPFTAGESIHDDDVEGMSLDEFIHHLQQKGRKGLYQEYTELKMKAMEGTFDAARLKSNQPKNRYSDVLCYDHSRVKISCLDGDPSSNYLNANFIDGYKQKNAFISTQGPLPKTFSHFWQMIWEQEVLVIVMTTRTIERSRAKCGQYWPKEEETYTDYGPFRIHNNDVDQHRDYTVTSLVVTHTWSGLCREVSHMQFTSWPDYGVPLSALEMLAFRDKVREQQAQSLLSLGSHWHGHALGPPIVVHCSAGIGRTGTFITLDISIQRLEATGQIDVQGTVEKIRSQRAYSIQTPDQYVFCHLALLEFALSRNLLKDVDLTGFDEADSESE
ncbi:tyrosine-protein phosphatase non-receptor type 9-like isoform X2 [Limulus polyphemus]|nr:tyrosine-protein phosphatase non-receptor type 9-like isoform X2 [Limulus polyphemus]